MQDVIIPLPTTSESGAFILARKHIRPDLVYIVMLRTNMTRCSETFEYIGESWPTTVSFLVTTMPDGRECHAGCEMSSRRRLATRFSGSREEFVLSKGQIEAAIQITIG